MAFFSLSQWIAAFRSLFLSLCVVCLLVLVLPSLLSTMWGGHFVKQLIRTFTHLEVEWKACFFSWFADSYIEDLSLIDPRTGNSARIKRIDSTWRPSFLFVSPRSIGTTSIHGADITFSLPASHQEKWPYPFIPSSLGESHTSKLPFDGTLYVDTSQLTCHITHDQQMTLKNVTLSLLAPSKGNIHCAFSATSSEESAERGSVALLIDYAPIHPRKLLQKDADAILALAENRLSFDMQIRKCPSLLVDALLQIRHPDNQPLISKAIGPLFNCFIHTEDQVQAHAQHISIAWESAFLQGACHIKPYDTHLTISTETPFTWTLTPDLIAHSLKHLTPLSGNLIGLQHPLLLTLSIPELILRPEEYQITLTGSVEAQIDPLLIHATSRAIPLQITSSSATLLFTPHHVHWDAEAGLEWNQKLFFISSSGECLAKTGLLCTLEQMQCSFEALPSQFLDLLLEQNIMTPLLGNTLALHVSMRPSPHQKLTRDLRIVFLAENMQCDPIHLLLGKDLRLTHPVHLKVQPPSLSLPLQITCESLLSSSKHPLEADFTLPIGKLEMVLSTCTLPLFSHTPFKIVGHAIFAQNPSLAKELLGPSLECLFSATSSQAECFLRGDGIEGALFLEDIHTKLPSLTQGRLLWTMGSERFATLQGLWPWLKEWTLYQDATWTVTAPKSPLPLSWEDLKQNKAPITVAVNPLSLLHIPSQYALSLNLNGLLDEHRHYHVYGSMLTQTDANDITPDFTVEGPLEDLLHPKGGMTCRFTGHELPTSLCTLLTYTMPDINALATGFMGQRCTLEGELALLPDTKQLALKMSTLSGMQFQIDATEQANRYILNRPCTLTMPLSLLTHPIDTYSVSKETEQLLRLLQVRLFEETDSSLSFKLLPEDSFLQLPFHSWDDIEIGQLIIEMGTVALKLPKQRSILSRILPQDILAGEIPFSLRTTPLLLSLHAGKLDLHRIDALVAERYPIAFWGKINIPKNHLKATLAISALALRSGYGLSDVSPGYYLLLPLSGSLSNILLHKTKTLTRLTALSLHSNGGIPGAFLGSFAHWLGGGFDPDQIPPPTFPVPWSALEEELERKQREREEQPPQSLPRVLIAPFQAVHRGIQTGVRKGADLLFNLLR